MLKPMTCEQRQSRISHRTQKISYIHIRICFCSEKPLAFHLINHLEIFTTLTAYKTVVGKILRN